ncbi:MAG: CARDB domain-containing protein [Thermoplasmata archaeon]
MTRGTSSPVIYQLSISYRVESRLKNVTMFIGPDPLGDWGASGEFYGRVSKLSSHILVDKMNDALGEQYVGSTNSISLRFISETAGRVFMDNMSIKYRILAIRGDAITNAAEVGVKFKNTKACMADLTFENVPSPEVELESSNITSVGCALLSGEVSVDSTSIIHMRNYLEVNLKDRSGSFISGGSVIIKESGGLEVLNRTLYSGHALIQARYCTKDSSGTINYTPHNITAQKLNITKSEERAMDQSQFVYFEFPRLDLRLIELGVSDDYPLASSTISINATIYDDGYESPSSALNVSFYLNNTESEELIENCTVGGLGAWSEMLLQGINVTLNKVGYQYIVGKIDAGGNVTEDYETDNVVYYRILVCDERKEDWSIGTETEYDGKVVVADSLSILSGLTFDNGILEVVEGDIVISSGSTLETYNTTIRGNDV